MQLYAILMEQNPLYVSLMQSLYLQLQLIFCFNIMNRT